ncbi:MAG: hypothetical protein AAFY64_05800, partial [Pseudomonadota bacterium]
IADQLTIDTDVERDMISLDAIIRSTASPVAHALMKAVAEAQNDCNGSPRQISVRALVVQPYSDCDDCADLGCADIRYAVGTNIDDAHEQLVIAGRAVWIGDCMRRDPIKLDAFEQFIDSDAEAVQWARVAFDRLWEMSQTPCERAGHGQLADLEGFDLASLTATATIVSATRDAFGRG